MMNEDILAVNFLFEHCRIEGFELGEMLCF